jgi:hypothetical protein
MSKKNTDNVAEGSEVVEAVEVPKVEIIRGRMPVAVVAMIRFQEAETATAACAAKYRTTVGKVDDIKKNRNFGYIDAGFQPSEDQKLKAAEYLTQLSEENAFVALKALDTMGIAKDGGASFEEARKAARKTKTPAPADTAGEDEVVEESDEDFGDLTD